MLVLTLLACIGAGIVGGVFYAFSTFVMKALSQLPASEGVAAMQRINVVVINPLFLGVFVGTAVLAAACAVASVIAWDPTRTPLLLAAGLFYLVGCFFVTLVCNVPRNEKLAQMVVRSPEADAYWPVYVREWTTWNHVRTAASIASAACSAIALTV